MPKLNKVYTLEITPEQFLNSCSPVELQEISLLLSNNFYQSRLQSRQCRVCGCSDYDCSQCIEKTNQACYWVEEDLCSACAINKGLVEINNKELIDLCEHYLILAQDHLGIYIMSHEINFKNEFFKKFGSHNSHLWMIFNRSFSEFYPLEIAEKFLEYLKEKNIAEAYGKILNDILELNKSSDE